MMSFPDHKTKTVCTIGPASRSRDVLEQLMLSGMDVARLNFSHGNPGQHLQDIRAIREISSSLNVNVAVLADLPGPKIRVGELEGGSCLLTQGSTVTLTVRDVQGTSSLIPVRFAGFAHSVQPGERIFLSDGFIELEVLGKSGDDVQCRVVVGGVLLSKKGLNLPDSNLNVDAVTDSDLRLMEFGMDAGVNLFGLSFVNGPDDIRKARAHAASRGRQVRLVAKIERKGALDRIDGIIEAADGIMVARGDLGVEIPIEQVPIVQKQLILKASFAAKPVITATQMLESMTGNTRPTRAEATDTANAVFDGTDAVMLSEETAIGSYPVESLRMLVKIARTSEDSRSKVVSGSVVPNAIMQAMELKGGSVDDVLSLNVVRSVVALGIRSVIVPSGSGLTARMISRFKGDIHIIAFCENDGVLKSLCLSYGVLPVAGPDLASDEETMAYLRGKGVISAGEPVILVQRCPVEGSAAGHGMKIITSD